MHEKRDETHLLFSEAKLKTIEFSKSKFNG